MRHPAAQPLSRPRLWTLLPLWLGLAAGASAQFVPSDQDRGDSEILQAFYGTERQHVDVTLRMRELAGADRVFAVSNEITGNDPAPGQVKTLRLLTRTTDGRTTRVVDLSEGTTFDGGRFVGAIPRTAYRGSWQGATTAAAAGVQPGGTPAQQPAAPGRDAGQYQILQALYGTERTHVDVTARLRELARSDDRLRMGNTTFGTDPDPGRVKTLRIVARGSDGQTRVFDYPENAVIDGSQFSGWSGGRFGDNAYRGGWQVGGTRNPGAPQGGDAGQYQILQALYGTERAHADVTSRLRELARSDNSFRMGNATFGADPDPGQVKTLRIYARGPDGQTRVFDYPENAVVDGSQFSGWSGGSFGDNSYRGGWEGRGPDNARGPGGRDEGDWRIVQALYGTARRNVDVTDQLRDLARSDEAVRLSRRVFGVDPDPGQRKTLRIFARGRDGQVRLFEYEPGSVVDGAQFRGWRGGQWASRDDWRGGWYGASAAPRGPVVRIVSAVYGSDARRVDVTQRLRARLADGGRIDTVVDDTLAGIDPAPGAPKALWLTYSVDGRPQQQIRVLENARLALP